MSGKRRPTGVSVLAALEALGGLIWLLIGAGVMIVSALLPMAMKLPAFFGAAAGLMGVVFLIFGIISFLLAYGLFTGRGWAWLGSLVFAVIGILLALPAAVVTLGAALLPIIIYLVMIYYLTRPHVKAFFGK